VIQNGYQSSNSGLEDDNQYDENVNQSLDFDLPPGDLARALEDWIDKDDESQLPSGSEDSYYSKRKIPYHTASQDISDVTELMAVTGFSQNDYQLYYLLMPKRMATTQGSSESEETEEEITEEVVYDQFGNPVIKLTPAAETYWGGVKHYLSALPFPSLVNVNTASPEVLQAFFTAEQANTIVQKRADSPYKSVEDIFFNLQTITKQEDKNRYIPYLSVNSNYFMSTVTVSIDETKFVLRSTLYRDEKGNVRVLKREFGR